MSLYLPRVISRSGTKGDHSFPVTSPEDEDNDLWQRWLRLNPFYNPLQLKRLTQPPPMPFSLSFMGDSRRNISHSITTILRTPRPRLSHMSPSLFPRHAVLSSACQPRQPPHPFRATLSDFLYHALPCTLLSWLRNHSYTHAFLLVFDSVTEVRYTLLT